MYFRIFLTIYRRNMSRSGNNNSPPSISIHQLLSCLAILLWVLFIACSDETPSTTQEADSKRNTSQDTKIYYHEPAWSPDGSQIAFSSNRDGNFEIYTIGSDGSNLQRLTFTDGSDGVPAWSPDGTRIAFAFQRGIHLMNADGSNRIRLTDTTQVSIASAPSWSPDGTRIAFEGRMVGNRDLFVMNADGSGTTRLTNDSANDFRPTWSPDGRRIAFNSNRNGNYDLFLMNADGSNTTQLTDSEVHETNPDWSPVGDKLLFQRIAIVDDQEKGLGLYILNLASREETRLTAASEREACWSPNGTKIAFITDSGSGSNFSIFTVNANGSSRRRLMPTP